MVIINYILHVKYLFLSIEAFCLHVILANLKEKSNISKQNIVVQQCHKQLSNVICALNIIIYLQSEAVNVLVTLTNKLTCIQFTYESGLVVHMLFVIFTEDTGLLYPVCFLYSLNRQSMQMWKTDGEYEPYPL